MKKECFVFILCFVLILNLICFIKNIQDKEEEIKRLKEENSVLEKDMNYYMDLYSETYSILIEEGLVDE